MPRSIIRTNDLNKVFKNGDSDLLNEIGALCILFEDFRIEVAGIRSFRFDIGDQLSHRMLHGILYYMRRSLITLDEVKVRLDAISANGEFRTLRHQMKAENFAAVVHARRFVNKNVVLKRFRNYIGAHIDPNKVVKSSVKYYGANAISRIQWSDTDDDFALQLNFATDILQGAIGSNLPGGIAALPDEMRKFFEVMVEASKHMMAAILVLIHAFLWDRFGSP